MKEEKITINWITFTMKSTPNLYTIILSIQPVEWDWIKVWKTKYTFGHKANTKNKVLIGFTLEDTWSNLLNKIQKLYAANWRWRETTKITKRWFRDDIFEEWEEYRISTNEKVTASLVSSRNIII